MLPIKIQLPEHFLDEEVRDGYIVSHEMKKVWAVELDLLNEFTRVCKKHNISFFSDSGTTVGAIRHHGFVPWDDDIDVIIFRKDYEKLCTLAPKEFSHPYFFQTEETDPSSLRGHIQLRNSLTTGILAVEKEQKFRFNQGIFIDIFILDNVPDDEQEQSKFFEACDRIREKAYQRRDFVERYLLLPRLNCLARLFNFIRYKILHSKLCFPKGYNTFAKESEVIKSQYQNDCFTKKIGNLGLHPIKKHRIRYRDDYSSSITTPFEFLEVPVPIGYDRILTNVYGNWRHPIHAESGHGNIILDAERPYTTNEVFNG